MKLMSKVAAVSLLALGTLAVSSRSASAAVVCNAEGECWHVHHHYGYRPEFGLVVHPDHWRWGPNDHYVWREHAGRGYWHGGVWVPF
jgi:hypothetical protein